MRTYKKDGQQGIKVCIQGIFEICLQVGFTGPCKAGRKHWVFCASLCFFDVVVRSGPCAHLCLGHIDTHVIDNVQHLSWKYMFREGKGQSMEKCFWDHFNDSWNMKCFRLERPQKTSETCSIKAFVQEKPSNDWETRISVQMFLDSWPAYILANQKIF